MCYVMANMVMNTIVGAIGEYGTSGYKYLNKQGYGLETTALSTALFNNGQTCGACFEVMCVDDPQWCLPSSTKVTATNLCPSVTSSDWCSPPHERFDLPDRCLNARIFSIRFQRVTCFERRGIKFELTRNPNFLFVLVYNVGGAGDVVDVKSKAQKQVGYR
ncbi:hypothetical protein ACFX2H_009479 [Malus domestica]